MTARDCVVITDGLRQETPRSLLYGRLGGKNFFLMYSPGVKFVNVPFVPKSAFRVSPTKIELHQGCRRKYAFALQNPSVFSSTEAKERGDRVHLLKEQWSKGETLDMTNPDAKFLLPALKYFAEPKTARIEEWHKIYLPDLDMYSIMRIDEETEDQIRDLKTTSSVYRGIQPGGWIPTTLEDDVQANFYAFARGKKSARWVYTDGKKGHPVESALPDPEAFVDALPLAQMRDDAHADPNTLPPNLDYCNAFRKPCEYMHLCNVVPLARLSRALKCKT